MKDTVMPKIVCLCGSTRFWTEFNRVNFHETMAGNICLMPGVFGNSKLSFQGQDFELSDEDKKALDELHKRKIDLADEVFVVNKEGYIGNSTRNEIKYALKARKPVRWLRLSGVSSMPRRIFTVTGMGSGTASRISVRPSLRSERKSDAV